MSTTSSAGISWTSVLPIRSATPGGATTLLTLTPSITVPLLEPRSVIAKPAAVGATEQWRRETNASVSTTSHALSVPITTPACGSSSSMPRSGPSSTRSSDAPACLRVATKFVTRVTSTSPQDPAQVQLTEVAIGFEPRHAADVEQLVDRQRAVDARQQEGRARTDRRVLQLVERLGELRLAIESAQVALKHLHDRIAVARDQLLGERAVRILGNREIDRTHGAFRIAGLQPTHGPIEQHVDAPSRLIVVRLVGGRVCVDL